MMKTMTASIIAILATVGVVGISDVYADKEASIDVTIDGCTEFTISGNTGNYGLVSTSLVFDEYTGTASSGEHIFSFNKRLITEQVTDSEGDFSFTISLDSISKTEYEFGFDETDKSTYGKWTIESQRTVDWSDLTQGAISIENTHAFYKKDNSVDPDVDWIHNHTEFEGSEQDWTFLSVRVNPATNEKCLYVFDDQNQPALQTRSLSTTELNDRIEKLDEARENKIKLKDHWKVKHQKCVDQKQDLKVTINSWKSKLNALQLIYDPLEEKHAVLEKLHEEADSERQRLQEENEELKTKLETTESKLEAIEAELQKAKDKIQELEPQ